MKTSRIQVIIQIEQLEYTTVHKGYCCVFPSLLCPTGIKPLICRCCTEKVKQIDLMLVYQLVGNISTLHSRIYRGCALSTPWKSFTRLLRKLHPLCKILHPHEKSKVGQFNSTLKQLSPKNAFIPIKSKKNQNFPPAAGFCRRIAAWARHMHQAPP